jgi:hypothetical protein
MAAPELMEPRALLKNEKIALPPSPFSDTNLSKICQPQMN